MSCQLSTSFEEVSRNLIHSPERTNQPTNPLGHPTESWIMAPPQQLSLCIFFTVVSGFLRVVATMILAFPAAHGKERRFSHVLGHVLLLFLAALLSVIGTWYGPVSIAVPVQTASQLLFNVIALEQLDMLPAPLDKAQRTGTCVVLASVLALMDVGPKPQDNQNVISLLKQPHAQVWCLGLTVGMVVAAVYTIMQAQNLRRRRTPVNQEEPAQSHLLSTNESLFVTLAVGVTLSNVGMATAGKTLSSLLGKAWTAAACYYSMSALLGLIFSVVSARTCSQEIFTPLSCVSVLFFNMWTGLIVWQDGKVMNGWMGYLCVCWLLCCGVYLLAVDVDLVQMWQQSSACTSSVISNSGIAEELCPSTRRDEPDITASLEEPLLVSPESRTDT